MLGYSYVSGNVLFDRSIPLYDVDSRINAGLVAYFHTLNLLGRTTNLLVDLPYSWGTTEGLVVDVPGRRDFSGIGDLGITMSVNLLGAPSMTPSDFQEFRANPRPTLGASLKIVAPTGHYEKGRLINVGANRWAIKPELGFMFPITPTWLLELGAGAWFFGDDDDFLPGKREQEPIFAGKAHLVKRFRPGFWVSLDFTYFTGGRQTIGGNRLADDQQNTKIGGTLVVPFRGRHAIKIGYVNGAHTEFGTDFDQFLVTYQVAFR